MKNQQTQTQITYPLNLEINPSQIHIKQWTFYTKKRGKQSQKIIQEYQQPCQIAKIQNLDQFFNYYVSIKAPSELQHDIKLMLFQSQCKPLWQKWSHSGCLILSFKDGKDSPQSDLLDFVWQILLFGLIGNQLDNQIIGLCLSKHQKISLIQIWLRTANRKQLIAQNLQTIINRQMQSKPKSMRKKIQFKYKQHSQSIKKQSTMKGAHSIKSSKFIFQN